MKLKNNFKKGTKRTVKENNFETINRAQLGKILGGGGTPTDPTVNSISLNSSRSNTSLTS